MDQANTFQVYAADQAVLPQEQQDIVYRLRKRAEIRLANTSRKSVQEGKPDRAAQMMIDAADEIEALRLEITNMRWEQSESRYS